LVKFIAKAIAKMLATVKHGSCP
jgi:hypothetical protein